jgi:uncharacterized protein (TIGR03067 family)
MHASYPRAQCIARGPTNAAFSSIVELLEAKYVNSAPLVGDVFTPCSRRVSMRRKISAVVAIALWAAVPVWSDDDAQKELKNLEGTWTTQSAEFDGSSIAELAKGLKFTVKGDSVTLTGQEEILKQFSKGTIKVNPNAKPKTVDFTVGGGDMKGHVIEAIYEFTKEDELKVCAKMAGKGRPSKFDSNEGGSIVLLIVKREKP